MRLKCLGVEWARSLDWWLVPGFQSVGWCITSLGLGFLFCKQQVKPDGPESSFQPQWLSFPDNSFLSHSPAPLRGLWHQQDQEEAQVMGPPCSCCLELRCCSSCQLALPSPLTHTLMLCSASRNKYWGSFSISSPALTFFQSIHRISYLFELRIFWPSFKNDISWSLFFLVPGFVILFVHPVLARLVANDLSWSALLSNVHSKIFMWTPVSFSIAGKQPLLQKKKKRAGKFH